MIIKGKIFFKVVEKGRYLCSISVLSVISVDVIFMYIQSTNFAILKHYLWHTWGRTVWNAELGLNVSL